MALENCRGNIEKAIGRKLTKDEAAFVSRKALGFQRRIEDARGNPDALKGLMDEAGARGAAIKARAERDAALQWQASVNLKSLRDEAYARDNPAKWLIGFMRGSNLKYAGARNSLAVDVMREGNTRAESMRAELNARNLRSVADSSDAKVKEAINESLHMIRSGASPQEAAARWGKSAADVAEIFNRHGETLRESLNRYGAWIGSNSDRTFRRTHDPNRVAKAGGNDYGSDAARDFWAREQNARMNWDKAFDGEFAHADEAERLNLLRKEFANHVAGHVDFLNDYGQGAKGRMGQRFSYQRKYVFNSPADDLAYFDKYGKGSTLLENREQELREGGKVIALMRRLGPRPEEQLRQFAADWIREINDEEPQKAKSLKEQLDSEMGNTWRLLTGAVGTPSDNFVARSFAAMRHTIGVAKTGLSIFSLPNDMVLAAAAHARFSSDAFQGTVRNQIAQITKAVAHLSKEDRQFVLAQAGSRWESSFRPIDPNALDHPGFGALYKFNGAVAQSYGHSLWDNAHRAGNIANDANIFARDMKQSLDKVALKEAMERFGITAKEWDVMRKAQTSKLSDGRDVLMPQHVSEIPLDTFKSIVSADNPSDAVLARTRDDVAAKYRNLLGEMADRSTSATSIENQAALGLGQINQKSPIAEAVRAIMQLKGWGWNYITKNLDAELRGQYRRYTSVGQATRDTMLGRNNKALIGISRMVAKGMAVAYVTNALRDLASGKTPLDPFDFDEKKHGGVMNTPGFQAAIHSFTKQGLGLYSDWIAQAFSPNQSAADRLFELGGPLGETIEDVGNLAVKRAREALTKGETPKEARSNEQRAYETGWRLIPGTEAWYSKAAMDAYVHNNIAETINPGYKRRLAKRAQEQGQMYWNGP